MANCRILIESTGDATGALATGIVVAKALGLECLAVHFADPKIANKTFSIGVSKDSRLTDVCRIYDLEISIRNLNPK